MTRGMNMRDMKLRSEARKTASARQDAPDPDPNPQSPIPNPSSPSPTRDKRPRPAIDRPGPPDAEDSEVYDDMGAATLADQGDGMHVTVSPRPSQAPVDDTFDSDFPDEPPPGWGQG